MIHWLKQSSKIKVKVKSKHYCETSLFKTFIGINELIKNVKYVKKAKILLKAKF